jgi:hypothetical protein
MLPIAFMDGIKPLNNNPPSISISALQILLFSFKKYILLAGLSLLLNEYEDIYIIVL